MPSQNPTDPNQDPPNQEPLDYSAPREVALFVNCFICGCLLDDADPDSKVVHNQNLHPENV